MSKRPSPSSLSPGPRGPAAWSCCRRRGAKCPRLGPEMLPRPVASPARQMERKVFLVVGECGDGKSTLIKELLDSQRSGQAAAGLHSREVTKEIVAYVGLPINGQPIDLLDTPGIGDTDVAPYEGVDAHRKQAHLRRDRWVQRH